MIAAKKMGVQINRSSDMISSLSSGLTNTIKDAISTFEELFKNEVLATEIYYEFNKGDFSDKFVIDGQEVQFGLERANI